MNLTAMLTYLGTLVKDTNLTPGFTQMINDVILEVASDFELPALKLLTPVPLTVNGTTWLWKLPDNFHKKLYRVRIALPPRGAVSISRTVSKFDGAQSGA